MDPTPLDLSTALAGERQLRAGLEHDLAQARHALQEAQDRLARSEQSVVQLRASQEWEQATLDSLINSIPDPISYRNIDGVYLGCNRAFGEIMGKQPSEIIGRCRSSPAKPGSTIPTGAARCSKP